MTESISARWPNRISSVPDNIIAFNGGDGVQVDTPTATGNLITRNRIFANGGLGINLTNGGNSDYPGPGHPEHHLRFHRLHPHCGFGLPRLRRAGLQQPGP